MATKAIKRVTRDLQEAQQSLRAILTSSEQLATVVATIKSEVWPVGAIFIAAVGTDPAALLGIGTWAAFGGRVPHGLDAGQEGALDKTGGVKMWKRTA